MEDFNNELAALLSKYCVAIISCGEDGKDAEIGFQSKSANNYWTGRNHLTGYELDVINKANKGKE